MHVRVVCMCESVCSCMGRGEVGGLAQRKGKERGREGGVQWCREGCETGLHHFLSPPLSSVCLLISPHLSSVCLLISPHLSSSPPATPLPDEPSPGLCVCVRVESGERERVCV